MSKETRLQKKNRTTVEEATAFCYWLQDLRGYLLEADFEGINQRIILNQFKRRLKRLKGDIGRVTNLMKYRDLAMGKRQFM